MTQLVYHPAFDPYQSVVRIMQILLAAENPVERQMLKILEFYLLFPEKIKTIRLSRQLRAHLKFIKAEPRYPYDRLPQPVLLYNRMEPSFEAALQTLISHRIILSLSSGAVELNQDVHGLRLQKIAQQRNDREVNLVSFIVRMAEEFESLGTDGIKDRSGLAEFRYDAI